MTTSESILTAIFSALSAANLGATVERDRTVPFPIDELPGIVVKPKSEETTPMGTGTLSGALFVEIEVHTRGATPSSLADPIAVGINSALIGNASLNGLIAKLFRTGKDWEFADSDGNAGKLSITYRMHFFESA